jgi:hypothetical protein
MFIGKAPAVRSLIGPPPVACDLGRTAPRDFRRFLLQCSTITLHCVTVLGCGKTLITPPRNQKDFGWVPGQILEAMGKQGMSPNWALSRSNDPLRQLYLKWVQRRNGSFYASPTAWTTPSSYVWCIVGWLLVQYEIRMGSFLCFKQSKMCPTMDFQVDYVFACPLSSFAWTDMRSTSWNFT